MEDGFALRHSGDELEAGSRSGPPLRSTAAAGAVDEPRGRDHFRQHHRHRLQRLDLDVLVAARLGMLDGEDADRAFEPDDRHAGEAVEALFAGLGPVGESRVIGRLGEVQDAALRAIVPTRPSPIRRRVTCTASLRRPWVANSSRLLSRSR